MKKISTVVIEEIQIFKDNQLTIGLDLGDRTSHYCILNEAGEIVLEQELPTTPKGIEEVFSKIPRSRIALETGTHSPWLSRQLNQLGHGVIVAHERNVRLISESSRKDDRLDARTLARLARIERSRDVGCFVGLRPGRRNSGQVTAPKSWTNFRRETGAKVDNQVAAPTVSRTPTWQRATIAHQRLRMEGWRQRRLGDVSRPPGHNGHGFDRESERRRNRCGPGNRESHGAEAGARLRGRGAGGTRQREPRDGSGKRCAQPARRRSRSPRVFASRKQRRRW
jgi:hypothetical protein